MTSGALNFEDAATLQQVTVVLVTYNSAHCIPLLSRGLRAVPNILVVDNASTDGTVDAVRQNLVQAVVFIQPQNLGFGTANNVALRSVQTPYALLVNPDCVIGAEQIGGLLVEAENWPDAAILAPQLLDREDHVDVNYRWPHQYWKPKCNEPAQAVCSTGFVTGAVMLFRMAEMRKIGFFDEDFFLYYEDDDLCRRVFNAKAGIVVVPQVKVRHASRGSVKGASTWSSEFWRGYHHAQSKVKFARKYSGLDAAKALRLRVLLVAWLSLPIRLLWPAPKYVGRLWGRICGLQAMNKSDSLS